MAYRFLQKIDDPTYWHGQYPTGYVDISAFNGHPAGWQVAEVGDASGLPENVYYPTAPARPPQPVEVWQRCSTWFDTHPLLWQMTWSPLVTLLQKQFVDVQQGIKSLEEVRTFVAGLSALPDADEGDIAALLGFFDTPVEAS